MDYGGVQRNTQIDPQGQAAGSTGDGSAYADGGTQSRDLREGNQGNVHTSDSEGRALTPDQAARLQETAIVDNNGAPIAVYHATGNMEFDTFAQGDTGFHFGTASQASKRAKSKSIKSGRMFRAYLAIKNPVRANHDIMGWHPGGTALYLRAIDILTDAECQEIQSLYHYGDDYDSPAAIRLREILESKGYDGIVYPNGYEGEGDSYMAFRDDQIIRSEITEFNSEETTHPTPKNESVGAADANFTGKQIVDTARNSQYDKLKMIEPKEEFHNGETARAAGTSEGDYEESLRKP